jgi:hypothetical protein
MRHQVLGRADGLHPDAENEKGSRPLSTKDRNILVSYGFSCDSSGWSEEGENA